jgi:hypothetical protein
MRLLILTALKLSAGSHPIRDYHAMPRRPLTTMVAPILFCECKDKYFLQSSLLGLTQPEVGSFQIIPGAASPVHRTRIRKTDVTRAKVFT